MEAKKIIEQIISAKRIQDILNVADLDKEYKGIAMMIHPDKCDLPMAQEALAKLNELRDQHKNGQLFSDDAGEFRTNGNFVEFSGDEALLKTSLNNYQKLMALPDADHLKRYLPDTISFKDGKLKIEFPKRAIPLSGLTLEQKHVNWVLSRMLEFSAMLHQNGYAHCGINPESVFIVPENHGIIVTSFYHMVGLDSAAKTISGKHKNWYPASLFREKIATSEVDVELSKRTSVYLLGDSSGSGVKLKKTHNQNFLDFVLTQSNDSREAYASYRQMIDKNFEKKFHVLDI